MKEKSQNFESMYKLIPSDFIPLKGIRDYFVRTNIHSKDSPHWRPSNFRLGTLFYYNVAITSVSAFGFYEAIKGIESLVN